MGEAGLLRHGGRLAQAQALWPHAPRPWLDLSTGISPFAYPAPRARGAERARLPNPMRLQALEAAAAAAFGVADAARVVAAGGAEAALRLLPGLLGVGSVAIAEPTYGGHAEAWRAAGASVLRWPEAEDAAGAVVVVNPNNPDGRRLQPERLLGLAGRLGRRGARLIVDESFVEAAPELSVAAATDPLAPIVLRSFGKAYGLAGLRLGFLVAEAALAARARLALGDWPVCADAIAAGVAAYADAPWLARTRLRLRRGAAWLDAALAADGWEIVGGTELFRLARSPEAPRRFAGLCAQGVLTRPLAADPALLRFGLPRPSQRGRLRRALQASR